MTDTRITADDTLYEKIFKISEKNPGATMLLTQIPLNSNEFLPYLGTFDTKHLYGSRIWKLYRDVCHENFGRFLYHLQMELPNQVTGELSLCGPHLAGMDSATELAFRQKRSFGAPNSFWALEHPPLGAYEYPIL